MNKLLLFIGMPMLAMQQSQQLTCPTCQTVIINIDHNEKEQLINEASIKKLKESERKKLLAITTCATLLTAGVTAITTLMTHSDKC